MDSMFFHVFKPILHKKCIFDLQSWRDRSNSSVQRASLFFNKVNKNGSDLCRGKKLNSFYWTLFLPGIFSPFLMPSHKIKKLISCSAHQHFTPQHSYWIEIFQTVPGSMCDIWALESSNCLPSQKIFTNE